MLSSIAKRQCVKPPPTFSLADGTIAEPLDVALHDVCLVKMQPADRMLGPTNGRKMARAVASESRAQR
jgi:hypothetical protein